MFPVRRILHAIISGLVAFLIIRNWTPDGSYDYVAIIIGVLVYLGDPLGPSRGGFGTHGDDDFNHGG